MENKKKPNNNDLIGKLCAYCQKKLEAGQEVTICRCDKLYHSRCWQDNDGCVEFGCGDTSKTIVTLSKEAEPKDKSEKPAAKNGGKTDYDIQPKPEIKIADETAMYKSASIKPELTKEDKKHKDYSTAATQVTKTPESFKYPKATTVKATKAAKIKSSKTKPAVTSKATTIKKVELPQQPAAKSSAVGKNDVDRSRQKVGAGRFRKILLIAAGLAVLGMVAAFAWSNFSNRYSFHYQFKSAVSTIGHAKVVREINLQTNGRSKVLVVSLRVTRGQGDIEVRESIPKLLAVSVKSIKFSRQPMRIINDDPVILWRFRAKKGGTNLIYRVNVNKKFRPEDFDKIVAGYQALPKLAKIIFTGPAVKVWAGQQTKVKAVGVLSDESTHTDMPFVWESSNYKLAEVDSHGRLTAKQAGKMTITVHIGKVKTTLPVTVLPLLKSIRIEPENINIRAGEGQRLSAIGIMSDDSKGPLKVNWSLVGAGGNGSIDSGGYFAAVTQGKVKLMAASGQITAQIEVDIQAVPQPPIVQKPKSSSHKSSKRSSRTRSRVPSPTPAPSPTPSPSPAPTSSPAPSPSPAPGGGSNGGGIAPSTNPPVSKSPRPIGVIIPKR